MKAIRHTFIAIVLSASAVAQAQQAFDSPDRAAQALEKALSTQDQPGLQNLLGQNWQQYLPRKRVDQASIDKFLKDWQTGHRIEQNGKTARLSVGADGWVLPIPIKQTGKGWQFDIAAGAEEIRVRTIGRNELSVIQAALGYVDAQREYHAAIHDASGIQAYAQKLISSPGKQDGLYWPTISGGPTSPLGPVFGNDTPGTDYHGYYYRILTAQGAQARGGALSYLENGHMTKGFALIAWPVSYGNSGVFSFMVDQDGTVYQKDLGSKTGQTARQIRTFNPDASWTRVPQPQGAR